MKDKRSFYEVIKLTFPDHEYVFCIEDSRGRFQNSQKVFDCALPFDE